MYKGFTKCDRKSQRLIFSSWLILTAIFSFLLISACTPSALRTNKYSVKKKSKNIEERAKLRKDSIPSDDESDQMADLLKNMEKVETKSQVEPSKEIPENDNSEMIVNNVYNKGKKLPTLREQMEKLNSDNEKQEQEIADLQNKSGKVDKKLEFYDKELEDLKRSISELRDAFQKLHESKKSPAIAGNDDIEEIKAPVKSSKKILSNEDVESSPKVKEKSTSKKVSKKKTIESNEAVQNQSIAEKKKTEIKANEEKKVNKNSPMNLPEFKDAMLTFAQKDYNNTINRLTQIESSTKDEYIKSDCNYWIGESHFGLKQYDKAIASFMKVLKTGISTPRKDDAQVMLAESYIRTGKVNDAKVAFQGLLEKYPQSEYIPRARKMLQQL